MNRRVQLLDQAGLRVRPNCVAAILRYVSLACGDNLIRDLEEQWRHPLGGVVIAGYRVDHSNRVYEARQIIQYWHRVRIVQGIAEFFQRVQVFDIVTCLVAWLGYFDIESSPFRHETRFGRLQDAQRRLDMRLLNFVKQWIKLAGPLLPVLLYCPSRT